MTFGHIQVSYEQKHEKQWQSSVLRISKQPSIRMIAFQQYTMFSKLLADFSMFTYLSTIIYCLYDPQISFLSY
jgi:hypothetical protein